jgi:MYXO-CTERM domain-containing protein
VLTLILSPAPAGAQPWRPNPTITWNTYLGGGTRSDGGVEANNEDRIEDVAIAPNGDVIVTGWTVSSTFPSDAGLPLATGSRQDAFVARFSPDGQTLRWARVFGGAEDDVGKAVAVTQTGVAFVVGRTRSSTINIAPGTAAPRATSYSFQGRVDAFLARVEADGTLDYVMYLGSTLDDEAEDIALGANDAVAYIVGRTGRDDGPLPGDKSDNTPIPFPPNNAQSNVRYRAFEAFVSQVDVSSQGDAPVRWTRILRSEENDIAYSVSIQGDTVYVGGQVGDRLIVEPGTVERDTFNLGANDGFVARMQTDAGIPWVRHMGGDGDDDVRSALARPGTNAGVTVVGNTNSSSNPVPGSGTDVYVLRLNGDGFPVGGGLRVSTTGSGQERTEGHSAMDAYGHVYIVGRTTSASGFTSNAFDSTFASGSTNDDGFIAMVDSDVQGSVLASYVGGLSTSEEWVQGAAVDSRGRLCVAGYSNAPGWLSAPIGYDRTSNGGRDGFLLSTVLGDTTPPIEAEVTATLFNGTLAATWADFVDGETPVTYEWGIGTSPRGTEQRAFEFVGSTRSITLNGFEPGFPGPFYVTVRATNAAGRTTTGYSNPFESPVVTFDAGTSDGGTSDGGTDAGTSSDGGTSDGGTDAGTSSDGGTGDEEDARAPLGWSCASSGGSGSLALAGLVVLVLLAARRERPAPVRARKRGGR